MSLTRAQWESIFKSANEIEKHAKGLISGVKKVHILHETKKIKELVQKVVGQLEQHDISRKISIRNDVAW